MSRSQHTSYLVSVDDQVGEYKSFRNKADALKAACIYVRHAAAKTATVVRITGSGEGAKVEALCTITPPITPPSTSPEVPNVH